MIATISLTLLLISMLSLLFHSLHAFHPQSIMGILLQEYLELSFKGNGNSPPPGTFNFGILVATYCFCCIQAFVAVMENSTKIITAIASTVYYLMIIPVVTFILLIGTFVAGLPKELLLPTFAISFISLAYPPIHHMFRDTKNRLWKIVGIFIGLIILLSLLILIKIPETLPDGILQQS